MMTITANAYKALTVYLAPLFSSFYKYECIQIQNNSIEWIL